VTNKLVIFLSQI